MPNDALMRETIVKMTCSFDAVRSGGSSEQEAFLQIQKYYHTTSPQLKGKQLSVLRERYENVLLRMNRR